MRRHNKIGRANSHCDFRLRLAPVARPLHSRRRATTCLRRRVASSVVKLFWPVLISSLFLVFAGCSDVIKTSHSTVADARLDIDRGWIPSILPASTVQIRESHDLDINTGHGTFAFGASDAQQFKVKLTALGSSELIRGARIPRVKMERQGFRFYRNDNFYLAIDWSNRRGEFWLPYSSR